MSDKAYRTLTHPLSRRRLEMENKLSEQGLKSIRNQPRHTLDELSLLGHIDAQAQTIARLEGELRTATGDCHPAACRDEMFWRAELAATRAAVLAQAAEIDQEEADVLKRNGFDAEAAHFEMNAYEIRKLITTADAAALAEVKRVARLEEAEWWDSQYSHNHAYPAQEYICR